ncbi:hypothetical protein JCM1840_006086 [Sporobolomyces johnsonii]
MAKGSGRFRNRKLGFKTRISVEVGVVIEEDPLDADLDVEDDKAHKGMETGVDKDEEGEVHLQAVIASTAAYVAKNTTAGSSSLDKGKKPASAYIPTRSSTTIPDDEYRALYKPGYVDPVSYIRFSDTVEDTTFGAVGYTMDEDDEDWLEDFNAQFEEGGAAGARDKGKGKADPAAADEAETPSGRGARVKGKAAAAAGGADVRIKGAEGLEDQPSPTEPLSEDDFERIMEAFEIVTDEKAPMAHVDTSVLPALADFEDAFDDILRPRLRALRPYAKVVYPHWRERRVQRHGKRIIPQLDYDESNEQNPYVCFRRRELKTSRKTRRSDQQNLERLIRLRNDLYAAHALMVKVAERERLKLEAIEVERQVFDRRCEMRELKRRLNEPDGDEELLISRREKRRKREDGSVGSLRLSLRKPDPSNVSPASLVPPMEEHTARKARNEAIMKQIERDLQRKRQNDQHWDDWTDSSYLARPPPTPARFWRAVEPTPNSIPFSTGKREALGFATQWQPPIGRVRSSFRKRVGRGGRILLDRIAPARRGDDDLPRLSWKRRLQPAESDASDADEEEDEWLAAKRRERLRYDTDVGLDFPAADEPALLDDFELRHLLRRVGLLKPTDVEALSIDSAYLDEAFRHAASDPDKHHPPPQVVGRPPPRPPLQVQPTGQPLPGQGGVPPNPAAYAQAQSAIAAQQALRAAQQQQAAAQAVAVQRQRQQQAAVAASQAAAAAAAAGGSPSDQMRRTPSQQGSPVGQAQVQLPLAMQQNGQGGLVLSAGFPNHAHLSPQSPQSMLPQQQQQQRLSPLPPPNGANGLPATSRLSAPPFSNPQALQLAIQQQQQALAAQQAAQAMAMSQAQAARPLSSNGPPSRPASAASHHSPGLQALPLPAGSAAMRAAAPGTPPTGSQAQKRASPMSYQLQAGPGGGQPLQMKQAQAQGYGGFVQG